MSSAVDGPVVRWIRRELATDAPRVPSLIVTIWGDALAPLGSEFWLSTIVRLLAPFRANQRAVRTALYRLHRAGWVVPRPVGRRARYALTPAGSDRFERAFHRVYDPPFTRWDGLWEGVIVGGDAGPALRRRVREELGWAGYGRFGVDTYLRPARDDDAAEGLGDLLQGSATLTAFTARDGVRTSTPSLADRVDAVWALGTLENDYRRFLARFSTLSEALRKPEVDAEQAFIVRTLLVHAYRRVRLRDPQLPREVLAERWPGGAAYATARTLYRAIRTRADRFVIDVLAAQEGATRNRRPAAPARFA